MSRVVHFEIHAEKPERAVQFYTELFGWQFKKWDGPVDYWLISTGPKEELGIDGGLVLRRGVIDGTAVIAFVCTVGIADIDASVKKCVSLGGEIALPKHAISGVGWLAYGKDTEGNIFGMMQPDKNAA